MKFKDWVKIKLLGYKATSESYIKHLKKLGIKIGDDVILFRPLNTTIDVQNPHLLEIGSHIMITGLVTIMTHDYSWSVIKYKYGDIIGNQKKTVLKDNIFIGWGSTILAGTYIGPNTIIGANSVVSGHLDGDSVYAGNSAKRIMSLDDYYRKRKNKMLKEAVAYVKLYKEHYGVVPSLKDMDEYFYLFFNPNDENEIKEFNHKLRLMGNYEPTLKKAMNTKPMFTSYQHFLEFCEERYDDLK